MNSRHLFVSMRPTRSRASQLAGIEGDVAEEDLRAALAVVPRDLFHVFGRALRGAEGAYPLRHELRLVDVRVRRPNGLALVDLVASLAGDDAGESLGVPVGQLQTNLPCHRSAQGDRLVSARG